MDNPISAAQAVKAAARQVRICLECADAFIPRREDQKFCAVPMKKCKARWFARAQKRGQMLYPIAMGWRGARGQGKVKLGEMTAMLDLWRTEDRERETRYERAIAALAKK